MAVTSAQLGLLVWVVVGSIPPTLLGLLAVFAIAKMRRGAIHVVVMVLYVAACCLWLSILLPGINSTNQRLPPEPAAMIVGAVAADAVCLSFLAYRIWIGRRDGGVRGFPVVQTVRHAGK